MIIVFCYQKKFYLPPSHKNIILYLLSFFYCCSITVVCIFSPPLHPTPAKPTSLPHLHPPPWFCPCVLYSSSCNPLSSLSPPHSPLAIIVRLFLKIWNASRICVSSLRRGRADLLCIVPILVYVLPKRALFLCFRFSC